MAVATPRAQSIALLDHDPGLGHTLGPGRHEQARASARVEMVPLPRGPCDFAALAARCAYGVLVLDGLLSRELLLNDTVSMQLLGRGDLLQPTLGPGEGFVEVTLSWQVLEPTSVALLDERFLLAVRRWPELVAGLFARLGTQMSRLATQQALCQLPRVEDRIEALLWLLAERWGKVTPQGVIVPLRLTHDMIGRLVGAKRPTVSLAVKLLDERGVLQRREDGAWLLGEAPAAGAKAARRGVEDAPRDLRHRRRG